MGKRRKTWKVAADSRAGMQVTPDSAAVVVDSGTEKNGLYVDTSGTYLSGKMSILSSPDQIRMGGLWTLNSPWLLMFPSTIAFPVPTLILSPPIKGLADIAAAIAWEVEKLG